MNTKNGDHHQDSVIRAESGCAHTSDSEIGHSGLRVTKDVSLDKETKETKGSQATISEPKIKRYVSLDHWRGIACLLVVINHATLPLCGDPMSLPGKHTIRAVAYEIEEPPPPVKTFHSDGAPSKFLVFLTTRMQFGVEMFFVISGYCVTSSALSLQCSRCKISEYFRRRFVRIFPPFWCALFCSVLACFAIDRIYPGLLKSSPWPLPVAWDLSPLQWLGCVTLTGTWIGYFTGQQQLSFPIQSWTLCYEEQFYAIVGILLACSGRQFFRAATVLTACILAVDIAALEFRFPVRGFFFDEHWFMFAAGVGVYWCLHRATRRQSMMFQTTLIGTIIGLLVLSRTTTLFGTGSQFSALRVVGALGFAQMLIWLKRYDERIENAKWLNWLKACGVMCYSIYLVHLFPGKLISQVMLVSGYHDDASILLLCVPLALTVSVALGYLFHVIVERSFLPSPRERKLPPGASDTPAEVADVAPNLAALRMSYSFQESSAVANRRGVEDQSGDTERRKAA